MTKKSTHITILALLAAVIMILSVSFTSNEVYAEEKEETVTYEGFTFHFWIDNGEVGSLWLEKYSGTAATVKLPTHIKYNGKEVPVSFISANAFANNQTIQKVIIPDGYQFIGEDAFMGCSKLQEVIIGTLPSETEYISIGENAFVDCPALRTVVIGWNGSGSEHYGNTGIGMSSGDDPLVNVSVYVAAGSKIEESINQSKEAGANVTVYSITTDTGKSKSAEANYKLVLPKSSDGSTVTPAKTAAAGGAEKAVEKYILSIKNEKDPKGTLFNLLQAKAVKVTKAAVTLKWKKVPGAKAYVIYGNKCGKTTKYVKLAKVKTLKKVFKKVAGKKVAKGTYYKFVVMAVNAKGKVVSTSKTVHAATLGGKFTNDKAVKTKAKKNKVTLKKGKKFSLKAKPVKLNAKKKIQRHRKICYESSKKKIAVVSAKGVITAKKKGTCFVYAYAPNGVTAKIKVTVK